VAVADPSLQAHVERVRATVAIDRGDPQKGLELADHALVLARSIGSTSIEAIALQTRSRAYDRVGNYDAAVADLNASIALRRAAYGDVHPAISQLEAELTLVLDHQGKSEESIAAARRALEIAEATTSPESDFVATAVGALGVVLGHASKFDEAIQMAERSLAIDKKLDGERGYNVASDLNNLSDLLAHAKRYDAAIADAKLAIDIWTEVLGPEGHEIGIALANLGRAQVDSGKPADAKASADRAIAILGKQPDTAEHGNALVVRAEAFVKLRDVAAAKRDYQTALAIFDKPGADTWMRDHVKAELAKLP
jgi:tetratricopeptide (TPR) repeat protein